ncbi:mat domain protein [Escherichia coli]|nr:mat domain protein [Escherichia coli]MCV8946848.1 mat domain protein [Escherichia coli]
MDKKICVVSMSVGKPASMTAAWINNELIMAERTSYPERRRDMELQLLRELREKEEKGFRGLRANGTKTYVYGITY